MLKRLLIEPLLFSILIWIQTYSLRSLEQSGVLRRKQSLWIGGISTCIILASILLNPIVGIVPAKDTLPMLRALLLLWTLFAPLSLGIYALSRRPQLRAKPGRRAALQAMSVAPWAAASYGIVVGRRDFQLKEVQVKIPNLPRALDGFRIVQLTDIHYGPFLSARDLRYVIGMANETNAHLAAVTGDLITNRSELLAECLDTMKDLRASIGVFGCHGNHESYAKCENTTDHLTGKMGWRILRGETTPIAWNGGSFFLSGVDYVWNPDIYLEELQHLPKAGETHILLSHNPDTFPAAARKGYDLQLSGHTHGGQVNMDILTHHVNPVRLITPFTRGLYEKRGRQCFVSAGIGTIGIPLRIGAPPEVALIRLCVS